MGRNKTNKLLRILGIVDQDNKPVQRYIDEGYLDLDYPLYSLNEELLKYRLH